MLKSNRREVMRKLDREIDARLKKSALVILAASQVRAPVDTGRLRASLTWLMEGRTVYVGTNVYYAVYVHQGTRYQSAQPFLVQGANSARSSITAIWREPVTL